MPIQQHWQGNCLPKPICRYQRFPHHTRHFHPHSLISPNKRINLRYTSIIYDFHEGIATYKTTAEMDEKPVENLCNRKEVLLVKQNKHESNL